MSPIFQHILRTSGVRTALIATLSLWLCFNASIGGISEQRLATIVTTVDGLIR